MLVVNYDNIGGKLSPGVMFVICLRSWGTILMMNVRSLLGCCPGEGLNLRFSISFMFLLVSLHGLVFVSSKTAFSIFASCIAFGLLHTCACNALCCNMSVSFDIISLQSLATHLFYWRFLLRVLVRPKGYIFRGLFLFPCLRFSLLWSTLSTSLRVCAKRLRCWSPTLCLVRRLCYILDLL